MVYMVQTLRTRPFHALSLLDLRKSVVGAATKFTTILNVDVICAFFGKIIHGS